MFIVLAVSLFSKNVQSYITKYCTIRYKPADTLLVVAREAEARRAGNRKHE